MKGYQNHLIYKIAAGGGLLLAVILIAACGANSPSGQANAAATEAPSPTSAPATTTATEPPPATETRTSSPPKSTGTPRPTATPRSAQAAAPKPMASPMAQQALSPGQINVAETAITIPTYPIKEYLIQEIDPVYNIPVLYFNRPQFEADAPSPTPVDYTGVILENPYLRLTFLPALGGRLYSVVVKATGQEIFYQNPVVKPSRYGVLQPVEANWWLATGGMEWAYPTQEHGYRWGVPWQYTVDQTAESATITLSDTAPDRVGVEVEVTLPADSAVFTVAPKLINATPNEVPVQFWLNAALTLGQDTMSPNTQFVAPIDRMVIHSRGDAGWRLPAAREEAPWPVVDGRDLRDYKQWTDYLGFFIPHLDAPFIGAYNPDADLGVVRLLEPGQVPGSKLFAFGQEFAYRDYTDDDSQYFEIWGGANTGFWPEDDISVAGGATLQWREHWRPVAGLGGVTWANQHAVTHLTISDEGRTLSALISRPTVGQITVLSGETPILSEDFSADPRTPVVWSFPPASAPLRIQLTDDNGRLLLNHTFE